MPNLPMPSGLSIPDLECVMLDIPPFRNMDRGFDGNMPLRDLFYGDVPELKYAQGLVGQKQAHATLLFGIHPSPDYISEVDDVLSGWEPEPIELDRVHYFPSSVKGQDYNVIVASVVETTNLLEGHDRLTQLPYTNQFETYQPHVTLAYIKGEADVYKWIDAMSWVLEGRTYPTRLNLGLDD